MFPSSKNPWELKVRFHHHATVTTCERGEKKDWFQPHGIHGTGVFTYIYHKSMVSVGKYSSPMELYGSKMGPLWAIIITYNLQLVLRGPSWNNKNQGSNSPNPRLPNTKHEDVYIWTPKKHTIQTPVHLQEVWLEDNRATWKIDGWKPILSFLDGLFFRCENGC